LHLTLTFASENTDSPVTASDGALAVHLGPAGDGIQIGELDEAGNSIVVNSATTFDGGTGCETLHWEDQENTFDFSPVVINVESAP